MFAIDQAAPRHPTGQLTQVSLALRAQYAKYCPHVGQSPHPPANRLEKLSGDRSGQYSIRVNDQWRICFEWIDGDAYNAEIVDDH
jgi:plasmid maintenance system killer protein